MELIDRITGFFNAIGLPCRSGEITEATFLPGITIEHGSLVFDPGKLTYPGDLLHEAGHLAVMPPERRRRAHQTVGKFAAEELGAITWSYAAAVHLLIDPAVVFHPDGYRGGSQSLIDNFAKGRFIGVPLLQWLGMTADAKTAADMGGSPYPVMLKWINEGPNGIFPKPKPAVAPGGGLVC